MGRDGKLIRAGNMVCDDDYETMRTRINSDVSRCMNGLISQTRNRQGRATTIFSDMYMKLEIGIVLMLAYRKEMPVTGYMQCMIDMLMAHGRECEKIFPQVIRQHGCQNAF